MNKSFILNIVLIIFILVGGYLGFNHFTKSLAEAVIKNTELVKEEAEKKYDISKDSIISIKNAIKVELEIEKDKPPKYIPKYNATIIYISVSDSTINKSFTNERRSYLEKQ